MKVLKEHEDIFRKLVALQANIWFSAGY